MTVTEARTKIRAATRHDNDTVFTDAQLDVEIDQELQRLRRYLGQRLPTLYQTTAAATINSGATTFNKPSDFERLILLEKLASGTNYFPVAVLGNDPINANRPGELSAEEFPTTFVVRPDVNAPGTYRITYITTVTAGYTTLVLPAGLEDVIIHRVAAWARQRHSEDPSWHERRANDILKEQMPALLRRYGRHVVPGMSRVRGY